MTTETAGETAIGFRDRALAALDEGDPAGALDLAREGLSVLAGAGLAGPDEAALRLAAAEIEEVLGDFDAAGTSAARAVELLGDACPPDEDDPDDWLLLWCQAQERLAGLERIAGDYDGAGTRLAAVLDRAAGHFGEASAPVISAANALGVTGKYSGDFESAQAAYDRALRALNATPDPDPLTRAGLLHNLGGLAHSRGDAEAGIPPAEEGLAIRTAVLGDDAPDVARDLNALGALYHLAERYDDASAAYQRALALFEAAYGPAHFEVAMTCANIAVLESDLERYGRAEASGRRAWRILKDLLGPTDPEVGLTLLNLSAAVNGQGRTEEAADLARQAHAILTARLPDGHPHVLAATQALDVFGPAK
jgi:tetratricopeptide (TPR) repeat protein